MAKRRKTKRKNRSYHNGKKMLSAFKGAGFKKRKKTGSKKNHSIKINQKQLSGTAPLNELDLFKSQLATKSSR